jgi:hypothetical protein
MNKFVKNIVINDWRLHTGYFTIDERDGIGNATHNTFAQQTWKFSASISRFALKMYCGLHFQFRRAHHHS